MTKGSSMKTAMVDRIFLLVLLCSFAICASCPAVTSTITRQKTAGVFLKGETDDTVIGSEGTISLSRKSEDIELGDLLDNVWMINTIVTDCKDNVYLGTSPNGDIIKYSKGKARRIYPDKCDFPDKPVANDPNAEEPFTNEHVFAMALDSANRLLAGVSGEDCRLVRFDGEKIEILFSDETVRYIFAIVLDDVGNIYLGTGPNGGVYRLNPFGKDAELVYDARDNSILSLAVGDDGAVYAGSDQRGLVYKIDQKDKTATVLYDSEQDEITALLLDADGNVYAAATSAQAVKEHVKSSSIAAQGGAGRPDLKAKPKEPKKNGSTTTIEIDNTSKSGSEAKSETPPEVPIGSLPKTAGRIYKITPEGFVTSIFSEMAVFYALAQKENQLLLATGNSAQLFSVNPDTEEKVIAFEDKQSSQMTAIAVRCEDVFLGCANPAKLIRFEDEYVSQGSFTSDLIDAGQPAQWGMLQINADIPEDCSVALSARTGNVKDANDPTFSPWTKSSKITEATLLGVPPGRFCQYRLTLKNSDSVDTPVVKEVSVAHLIGNLAPKVTSVKMIRSSDKNKRGAFIVSWTAMDRNKDALIYQVDFRRLGRLGWIKLKDKITSTKYEWNSNTVEDARYEVRVTADDRRSNTARTAMTGSRVSDVFVVDNTPPAITNATVKAKKKAVTLKFSVKDEFTVIGRVSYTVDSNDEWIATLPNDSVYDTTKEDFTIQIKDLDSGEHVIAVKISDDIGNTVYKTFDISIK